MKTEAAIQQECFLWYHNTFCLANHNPRHVIFSVPNESNSKKETMRKKAIGMVSGVSDLIIVRPGEVIFCEIKTDTGRQSDTQKRFEKTVTDMGYRYILVRSLEDFVEYLKR